MTVLLRVNSLSVLGIVVHEGVDGATVKLIDLEKLRLTMDFSSQLFAGPALSGGISRITLSKSLLYTNGC